MVGITYLLFLEEYDNLDFGVDWGSSYSIDIYTVPFQKEVF
jgi:hypothetical protein